MTEETIKSVIKKVREIFCFGVYKNITAEHPLIELLENDKGNIELRGITFDHYHDGVVSIEENRVRFRPYYQDDFYATWEYGQWEELMTYDGIEEFLNGEWRTDDKSNSD